MKRILTATALVATAVVALGSASFTKVTKDTYKIKPTSAAGKAGCMLCHTMKVPTKGNCAENSYGKDLTVAMGKDKTFTAAHLKKVENLDSDKDGVKNGAELFAGTLPGDPKSK